jgi:tetratricopeptide (TPR) repeat protein
MATKPGITEQQKAASLAKSLDSKLASAPAPAAKKKKPFDPKRDPMSYTSDELDQMVADGDLKDVFTQENLARFVRGEITWAELTGLSMHEAYAFATIAYNLFEQGKYDQAQTIVEGLVISNPYDGYFHSLLASIYGRKGMLDEARDAYTVAIELDGKNLSALVNRAEINLQRGEVEKALKDLKRAVDLDPNAEQPFGVRARALAAATAAVLEEALRQKGVSLDAELAKRANKAKK